MKLKFESIYDILKQQFDSITPGTRLPTVRDLMSKHDAAQVTIQKVLDRLEKEGVISRHTGRGTFKSDGSDSEKYATQKKILLALPMHSSPFFDSFTKHFLYEIDARNDISSINRYNANEPVTRWLKGSSKYDAVVLIPPGIQLEIETLSKLKKSGTPLIVVDRNISGLSTDCVCTDHLMGGSLAARLLKEIQCKKPAVLIAEPEVSTITDRFTAFKRELELQGDSEPLIINSNTKVGEMSCQKAHEAVTLHLKENGLDFDGLFCVSDPCALGAMKALYDHGISVPDQVSVIGYDNMDYTEFLSPSLTTISQDIQALAKNSIDVVHMKLEQDKHKNHQVLLAPTLVIRESTL